MSDRPKDGFLVQGKVDEPRAGQFIALFKVTPQAEVLVDSVQADENGAFRFIGKVDELQMFMLRAYGQSDFFVAGNEDVDVRVKGKGTATEIDVNAGEEQKKLKPVLNLFRRQQAELAPMNYEYVLAVQNRDMDRAQRYRSMMERAMGFFNDQYKHLIDSLGPSFGAYTAATRLNPAEHIGTLDTLARQIAVKYPNQAWATSFSQEVAKFKEEAAVTAELGEGKTAPNFKLPTPDGKKHLGPADFRGKYLVLDFWASWCRPCRMNAPQMVSLYKKYKARGVEFLGVSLDRPGDEAKWKKAIADDGYGWPQVSELKEWESGVVKQYAIQGIPHLVLLDKEGNIVARGITPDALDQILGATL